MSKFKVGDRVRIIESDNEYGHGFDVGSVIEVKRVRELWDGIDYECYGEEIAQTVRERDIEPCAPDRNIQLNHQYTSKNGQKWECIAVRGDTAWLAMVFDGKANGSAYSYKTDGSAICLGSSAHEYDIKWEPVVEWVDVAATYDPERSKVVSGHAFNSGYHRINIRFPLINGTPDFTQATVTPV